MQVGPDSIYYESYPWPEGITLKQLENELLPRACLPRKERHMRFRKHPLPRGQEYFWSGNWSLGVPTEMPIYKYSAFQWLSVPFYKPLADLPISSCLYKTLPYAANHMILSSYEHENDRIGWHQDNTETFVTNSYVQLFSFGSDREFQLRWYHQSEFFPFIMQSGSAFFMGPETNRLMEHRLCPIKKELLLDHDRPTGKRVSLIFRDIQLKDGAFIRRQVKSRLQKLDPKYREQVKQQMEL